LLVEPGEHERHAIAVAAVEVDAHLGGGRCRLAAHATDEHTVMCLLPQLDGVEAGGDVGVGYCGEPISYSSCEVTVPTLTTPAGAGVLGDHTGAVGGDLGDGEAGAARVGSGISVNHE
jgi:hypothetical protein